MAIQKSESHATALLKPGGGGVELPKGRFHHVKEDDSGLWATIVKAIKAVLKFFFPCCFGQTEPTARARLPLSEAPLLEFSLGTEMQPGQIGYFEGRKEETIACLDPSASQYATDMRADRGGRGAPPACTVHALMAVTGFTESDDDFPDKAFLRGDVRNLSQMQNRIIRGRGLPLHRQLCEERKRYLRDKVEEMGKAGRQLPGWIDSAIDKLEVMPGLRLQGVSREVENFITREVTDRFSMKDFMDSEQSRYYKGLLPPRVLESFGQVEEGVSGTLILHEIPGMPTISDQIQRCIVEPLTQESRERFSAAMITTTNNLTFSVIYDRANKQAIIFDSHRNSIRLTADHALKDSLLLLLREIYLERGHVIPVAQEGTFITFDVAIAKDL